MSGLDDVVERAKRRREEDARRFEQLDPDQCMLCEADGPDMRSLRIDCGYAIYEAVAEVIDVTNLGLDMKHGYYLRICKTCRSELLGALAEWAGGCRARRAFPKDSDGEVLVSYHPERNIPVRVHGATRMVTLEEYRQMYPGREPIRLRPPPDSAAP